LLACHQTESLELLPVIFKMVLIAHTSSFIP
jgi:hypothetical protein